MSCILGVTIDTAPAIGGSLLVVAIGFTLKLMQQSNRLWRAQARETEGLRSQLDRQQAVYQARLDETTAAHNRELDLMWAKNRACDRRVNLLVNACQHGGITIPEEYWNL